MQQSIDEDAAYGHMLNVYLDKTYGREPEEGVSAKTASGPDCPDRGDDDDEDD